MSAADLNYIEAPALAELLEDDAAAGGLAIIDVRDEDFLGSHPRLKEQFIIVTCACSRRGAHPRCREPSI